MKGKILESLKTLYADKGFGDTAYDGVADFLAKTITKEDEIETAVKGVGDLLKAFQSDIDKVRTENARLKKEDEKKETPKEKEDKEKETKVDEDKPLTRKELLEILNQSSEKAQKEKAFESLKTTALKNLEKKGVKGATATKLANQIQYKEDLTLDEIEKSIQTEYDEIKSDFTPEAGRPQGGSGSGSGGVGSDLKDYIAKKQASINKSLEQTTKN